MTNPKSALILQFPSTKEHADRFAQIECDRFNAKIDAEIAEIHAKVDADIKRRHGSLYGLGISLMMKPITHIGNWS